ncbi:MAG: tol-pal system protein YbgF [Xanthomonadales bacterium]|nr:tol-pal system protein YbgF [Xanthomonadales bacterium]
MAAVAVCGPAWAQSGSRLSLAERVALLERQQAQSQSQDQAIEWLQRLNDMQSELQSLRSQVEVLERELESLKKRSNDQYLDLDGRLRSGGSASGTQAGVPLPPPTGAMSPVEDELAFPSSVPDSTGADPVLDAAAAASRRDAEMAAYDHAFEALKQGNYQESARRFGAYLAEFPDGENAANATYWLGESHYVNQRYPEALKRFQALLQQFPNSARAPDALLKVGYCYHQIGDTQRATQTLNSVIQRYPNTAVAGLAETRLRAIRSSAR